MTTANITTNAALLNEAMSITWLMEEKPATFFGLEVSLMRQASGRCKDFGASLIVISAETNEVFKQVVKHVREQLHLRPEVGTRALWLKADRVRLHAIEESEE